MMLDCWDLQEWKSSIKKYIRQVDSAFLVRRYGFVWGRNFGQLHIDLAHLLARTFLSSIQIKRNSMINKQ